MAAASTHRVLVSPHLDDLVLSCFGALLTGPGTAAVTAVTVFTAEPDRAGVLSDWDAQCGADSSRELTRRRRDEDRRAMSLAGAAVDHLPFLEQHHRAEAADTGGFTGALAEALAERLAGATEVWVPAAVYGNPDHSLVRSVTFSVLARVPVPSVWLYAEYPYHQYLSPGPASRQRTAADLAAWFRQRVQSGASDRRAAPTVRTLDPAEVALKRQAVGCYASQLAPLDRTLDGRLLDPHLLLDEYAWQLRGAPAAAPTAAAAVAPR
jgi:LmbE family N-acetylglucosaminyl deacetylase